MTFASALKSATSLTHLNLGWNGFGDLDPASEIADALKQVSCGLTYLDLSHNRVAEKSAFLIAEKIEANKTLQKLVLDGNPLGKSGCRRIMGVYKERAFGLYFRVSHCWSV